MDDTEGYVPYAPDLTPSTLGKAIGEDRVLSYLLELADSSPSKGEFINQVIEDCLSHIPNAKDRRDMASHVLQGLRNYLLVEEDKDGTLAATPIGKRLASLPVEEQSRELALHILTDCNGLRFCEAILQFELRGELPTMEDLCHVGLDRHPTSKSISTMKVWLQRGGVLKPGRRYRVDRRAMSELLGGAYEGFAGLSPREAEFIFAARLYGIQHDQEVLSAPDVAKLTRVRRPDTRIPSKGLQGFLKSLEEKGLVTRTREMQRGWGGTRVAFRLTDTASLLSEERLRSLMSQVGLGYPVVRMRPLSELLENLDTGQAQKIGDAGEQLAIHICLMLGLRVLGRNIRAPLAEIDVLAERTSGLTYQRWAIQVKNITSTTKVDIDRIDRELGAVAGTGITHVLFFLPRSCTTGYAKAELLKKNALTPLHLYVLDAEAVGDEPTASTLIKELEAQAKLIAQLKTDESSRRERH